MLRFLSSSVVMLALAFSTAAACGSDARTTSGNDGTADASCPQCAAPDGDDASSGGSDASTCPECADGRIVLRDGWTMQSSTKVAEAGAQISTRGYSAAGWLPITVPTTVLAGLVANHVVVDPYVGTNLRAIAPLTDGSWWYRTELALPADFAGQAVWLDLDGINYRANVWLNGTMIASSADVAGTFTAHEWNVSAAARAGETNALAVEILPPDLTSDLALSWLDWNPTPPDRDMGIWRDVYLKKSGAVAVRGTHVLSSLDPSLATAHLTVKADVRNTTSAPVHGTLDVTIDAIHVTTDFDLASGEGKTLILDPAHFPALDVSHPKLWWPAQLGAQDQYTVTARALVAGAISDTQVSRFGVRDVTFEPIGSGARVFRINGKRVLIRGGGWAPDMMLRASPERLDAQLRLVREMGLNAIRLEGKLETDEFYARADDYGILTIPGWMCCDRWQAWDKWTAEDHRIAKASMDTQARRLRNHPSVIDFLIGSDEAPPPDVESELLAILREDDWPNPVSASASDDTTPGLGATGVKMTGPYDWVAPSYWYVDDAHGGAFGFNTETGPGPAIREIESLRATLDPGELDDLWSKPDAKHFHAGTAGLQFDNLSLFNGALAARYGAATSLEDYVMKAQLMSYEAERAPFEAYGRNKYANATGIVHWMLNNAWPSLIWHLIDYDLATSAAYFGAKKGNEGIHIQYSYDDRSVVVVNHGPAPAPGMTASIRLVDLSGETRFSQDLPIDVGEDAALRIATLPAPAGISATYFAVLTLASAGEVKSRNVYWLSTRDEVVDLGKSDWYHAPTSAFADYTALAQLPPVTLGAAVTSEASGQGGQEVTTHVSLENGSTAVAFFVRLKLTRGAAPDAEAVLPAYWEDNYVTLMPGEKRSIAVRCRASDLAGAKSAVQIRGWNVAAKVVGG